MQLTRWRIKQQSGSRSPWHSDTLLGCLCWAVAHLEGVDKLHELFSKCYGGIPPFVVSDGFPAGFLPIPSGGDFAVIPNMSAIKAERDAAITALKPIKRLEYLSEELFINALHGEIISVNDRTPRPAKKREMIVHNSINRLTGSTLDRALYRSSYLWFGEVDIYARVDDDANALFERCLRLVGERGFGGGASRGMGAFDVEQIDVPKGIEDAEAPTGFITLSRCSPTPSMPTHSQYRLDIKYGRLGQERAGSKNPFKLPVPMLCPGAVFWGDIPESGWCGQLVSGVSLAEEYQDVVQCGLAITLPARIKISGCDE